jgi:hypothetical protein
VISYRASLGQTSRSRSGALGRSASAAEVAAPDPPVGVGPEPALQLHEAPDLGAVDPEIRLDVGGYRAEGGQVDASSWAHCSRGAASGRPKVGSLASQALMALA